MSKEIIRQLKTNLGIVRNAHGETQAETAQHLERSSSFVGNYESKRSNPPNFESLIRFAQRYQVAVDDLIFGNFSNTTSIKSLIENNEKSQKLLIFLIPLVSSADALENTSFKKRI